MRIILLLLYGVRSPDGEWTQVKGTRITRMKRIGLSRISFDYNFDLLRLRRGFFYDFLRAQSARYF